MTKFTWVHFSDLHQGMSDQKWLWPQVSEILINDLKSIHKKTGPWDAVLFTGDLTQKGTKEEFENLNKELSKLWKTFRELGSNPVLLPVPGNHDLFRPSTTAPESIALKQWHKNASMRREFWSKRDSALRTFTRSNFSAYTDWLNNHPFPRPSQMKHGALPGDFSATLKKDELSIGFLGLNSAFLQIAAGRYTNRLALSPAQFQEATTGDGPSWASQHNICILMTHHPPDWLSAESQQVLNGEIAPPGRFAIHLFGHMHSQAMRKLSIGGGQAAWRQWQGASVFGLESYGNGKVARTHGYSVGRISLAPGAEVAELRQWPRQAVRESSGRWKIVPDHTNADLQEDEATTPDNIPIRQPARTSARPQTLRILLLSTDKDLQEHRQRTADYLSQVLGIHVEHDNGSSSASTSNFDASFLIQGWWWDNGVAADKWRTTPSHDRILLAVEEGVSWPPLKLAEISAHSEIRSFLASAKPTTTFDSPDKLPELIGKHVASIIEERHSKSGWKGRGLRTWERKYLELRLPNWTTGRTAGGRTHLIDTEQATELYRPELYVPLLGENPRWLCEDGRPDRPFVATDEKQAVTLEKNNYAPLSAWISHPELPRIAMVGAPGGGKTVFLTRIAAHLGSLCLGRPVKLETLDLNALRGVGGEMPIPIVIEASRIADHDCGNISAILTTISNETTLSDGSSPPLRDLEDGLREGRYLLLVDALDEISDATKRGQALNIIKGMSGSEFFPKTRIIISTRSARYTGTLSFGPEFEVVTVSPFNDPQISAFCERWTQHRRRDYLTALLSAVSGLADSAVTEGDDRSLTGNPLTLTAICMVYERHRSLPDDRAELCALLVDDLCRSRTSKDSNRGWTFSDADKRDLLERIALAMQESGSQSWAVSLANEVALRGVPASELDRTARAARHVQWVAEHTDVYYDLSSQKTAQKKSDSGIAFSENT
ncbi:metallophosphoesterase [Corallococcus sp. M7]